VSSTDGGTTRDPMDRLAESFLERFRRGERPSITDYIANNPDHASDIQKLFPALVEIEQLKSTDSTDFIAFTVIGAIAGLLGGVAFRHNRLAHSPRFRRKSRPSQARKSDG
jgi:hypothetical protein